MIIDKDNVAEYVHARHLLHVPEGVEYTVEALGGGFLNTVLRIRSEGESVIVKQALDALRLFPDLKVTTERIVFERKALDVINKLFPGGTAPEVLHFDDENRILVMGDLGATPILESQLIEGHVDPLTPEHLGKFLAELHRGTIDDGVLRSDFDNEAMQQLRLTYCFNFIEDPALLAIAKDLGSLFTEQKRVLLHGDFWTASVMAGTSEVRVFDLEFTYYGHPAQDVGFMMAHYMLHAFNTPSLADIIMVAVGGLWRTYRHGMGELLPDDTETSALKQAGIEMLFRIDGINQVKYIKDENVKLRIRGAAKQLMIDEELSIASLEDLITT
ncbi:MAG: phosphotransferase [Bacteroidetes Order II. Incertae sedis bacterium]|jgi:5-methylthioribose kinase|nr:phosphotransferase [Bacteroidetes Order II. bacterium]